jgi:hypothetical protein
MSDNKWNNIYRACLLISIYHYKNRTWKNEESNWVFLDVVSNITKKKKTAEQEFSYNKQLSVSLKHLKLYSNGVI